MNDELNLPPLPEPEGTYWENDQYGHATLEKSGDYTADQMREYAKKAVEAEREASTPTRTMTPFM